jgi:hypothetical protein
MGINETSTNADATFQVRLYETSNVIQFVYGPSMTVSQTTGGVTTNCLIGFNNGSSGMLYISNSNTNTTATSYTTMTANSTNVQYLDGKSYAFYPPQSSSTISSMGLTSTSNVSFSNTNVTIDQNTTINNIYVNDNAKLTLASGVTLTVNGDIICADRGYVVGSTTANVVINGSGTGSNLRLDQTTYGSTNCLKNLTLNRSGGSAILSSRVEIASSGILTLTAGKLIINDTLKLTSDATGTAMIAAIPDANLGTNFGGTNTTATYDPISLGTTGCIKACRYIPSSGRRWRFLSGNGIKNTNFEDLRGEIYVTGAGSGTTVGSLNSNGFDATATNAPSIYTFNEATYGWVAVTNSTSSLTNLPVSASKGYRIMVRGDRSDLGRLSGTNNTQNSVIADFNGDFTRGNVTVPVTYTSSASTPGWNLVSNPYPAAFNWKAFYTAGHSGTNGTYYTNIDPIIYIFNGATNSYVSYNALSDVASDPAFAGGIIPRGASFFVRTTGSSPSITLREQFKYTTTSPVLF